MKARAFWLSGALGLFIGCNGGGGDSDCQPGTLFCECFNGTCQGNLVCTNNYCQSLEDETSGNADLGDGDGDPGDGDPDAGDGDGDGDGDPDAGDGDGDGDGDPDTGDGDGDGDGDTDAGDGD